MRRLTIFVVALAVIYSGYWFVGQRAVLQAAEAQISDLRAQGWAVDYDTLNVNGYPSRFDTNATSLRISGPQGDVGYAAPFLQALALSYQPNKVIVAFPAEQQIRLRSEDLILRSLGLRASLSLGANTALSLKNLTAEAEDLALTNVAGDTIAATGLLAALRESGPLPNTYDLYANAQNLQLPVGLMTILNQAGTLPNTIDILRADATVVFDRPLNRHTLPAWSQDPGQVRGVTLKDLNLRWGDLAIGGGGSLTVDASGTPDGTITLTANDWQRMLDIAVEAGLIPADLRFMATSMGQTLSQGAANLELPITFRNGNLSVGPIPLGPAPKFF